MQGKDGWICRMQPCDRVAPCCRGGGIGVFSFLVCAVSVSEGKMIGAEECSKAGFCGNDWEGCAPMIRFGVGGYVVGGCSLLLPE